MELVSNKQDVAAVMPPPQRVYSVRVHNHGRDRHRQWVDLAVPPAVVEDLLRDSDLGLSLETLDGRLLPLYRVGPRCADTTHWQAQVVAPPGETTMRLVAAPKVPLQKSLHPFVSDDVAKLLFAVDVTVGERTYSTDPSGWSLAAAEDSESRWVTRFFQRVVGTPLSVGGHVYFDHDQPIVKWELRVSLSDVDGTEHAGTGPYAVDSIVLRCGEAPFIHHAARIGASPLGARRADGTYVALLSGPRSIGRGECPFYRGWLVCMPEPETPTELAGVAFQETARSVLTGGAVHAVSLDWAGNFGPLGEVPQIPVGWSAGGRVEADRQSLIHLLSMQQRGDMYDQRPLGLLQRTGSTGGQDDFSAAQDVYALTCGDPRRIDALWFSVGGDFLRCYHNQETDGRPAAFRDHATTRTWAMRPERRVGAQDLLGWPEVPSPSGSGWSGYDDQHRSQELLVCLMTVQSSYELQRALTQAVHCDLASALVWQNRCDSPRGEGRMSAFYADALGLLDDEALVAELRALAARRASIQVATSDGREIPDDYEHFVRPTYVGAASFPPSIPREPAVVFWEASIQVMGYLALWRRTGDENVRRLMLQLCELCVRWGAFRFADRWHCVVSAKWLPGGQPLPPEAYVFPSPWLNSDDNRSGWWVWCLPPFLVLLAEWPEHALAARAREVVAEVYGAGPMTEMAAEWWALVPRSALPVPPG